jgi:hypothetical protein
VGADAWWQFIMALIMYLLSRKFHPSFGLPGTEVTGTYAEQQAAKVKGWEWWPSIFWQVFWAWVVAPVVLWRARDINDTQGWRMQTIACCLAQLHAAPMWVISLTVPAMAAVNNWFPPPQWYVIDPPVPVPRF